MNTGNGARSGDAETGDHAARSFQHGLRDSVPLGISFFFIFLAVGAASKAVGLTLGTATIMSLVVFAAPAQLAIFDLMGHHRPWLDILAATVIINARFFVMSATLLPYFRGTPLPRILAAMPMLSASTFTVPFIRFKQAADVRPFAYYLGVSAGSYPVAGAATALGLLLVQDIPGWALESLKMILPIYFTTLLAREWPNRLPLLAGLAGFVITPFAEIAAPAAGMILTPLLVGGGLVFLEERNA